MSDDVKLGIGVDDSPLAAGLARVQASVTSATEKMKSSFEGVSASFAKIQNAFIGLGALLAGGEIFGKVISSSIEWAEGNKRLAAAMGISTERASDYSVAMNHLGIGNDVLIAATQKMSQQIFKNGDAFKTLGVQVKTSGGAFRPMGDILQEVLTKLVAITDPIARNAAGVQIFGRAWAEFIPLMKLTAQALAEATARAKALGLETGPQQEAQAKAYSQAMRDLGLVGTSLSVSLGGQLIPALTQISLAFASEGPAAGKAFAEALRIVAYVGGTISIELTKLGKGIGALGAAAMALLHGDLAGAKAIMADLGQDVDKLNAKADALWANLHKPLPPPPKIEEPALTKGPFDPKEQHASLMAGLEADLAAVKATYDARQAAQGSFGEYSKAQEKAYWENILATTTLSSTDQKAVQKKISEDSIAISKEKFQAELAELKASESSYKNDLESKLAIAKEYAQKLQTAADNGGDAKAAKAAAGAVLAIERELAAQRLQIAETNAQSRDKIALFGISAEETAAKQRVALGIETNAQLLAEEAGFEDRKFAIEEAALQKSLALAMQDADKNPVKVAQLNAEIEALALTHSEKMTQIANQTTLEENKTWMSLFSSMQSGFQGVLSKMLQGQLSLTQSIHQMYTSIASSIANTLAQVAAKNIATMLQQAAVGKGIRAKEIAGDASKAASGAYSAIAGIPWVGPFLAPAAAAVAYGAVMAFDASAAQGYDIPAGINPVVQTHASEMILPASLADRVRAMTAGGANPMGDDSGGGPSVNVSFPGKDLGNHFLIHKDDLLVAIKTLIRNGNLSG